VERKHDTNATKFATRLLSIGVRVPLEFFKLLELAMEQANDGIAIMKFTRDADVPIRIVYANAAIERFSGFSRKELLARSNPFLRAQPQNRARYAALLAQVRAGHAVEFDIELTGKDRSTWAEIRWSPLRFRRREVTHYVAVLRDITKRKQAESERDLLHQAIEQARDGLCILELPSGDPQRRFVSYANDAVCEIMKVSREHILRTGLADLLFAGAPELQEQATRDIVNGITVDRDLLATLGDATQRWIHVTASPVRAESGRIERVAVTYRDVHDRRRNDEQLALFQSMQSQTSDFIVATDAGRPSQGGPTITYANQAFTVLTGLEFDQIVGRSLLNIFSERNEGRALANIVSRLEHHQRISHELQLRNAQSGTDVWIELSGHHIRDESGRPGSWIFIGNNISARKQSYVQIAQLMTALDVADEPIVIYDVIRPLELTLQHKNARASQSDRPVLETMLESSAQRERIKTAWPALEKGLRVNRLVRVTGPSARQRWVTLELRPVTWGRGKVSSLIAIEHGSRLAVHDPKDDIAMAIALSREILGYASRGARRDAFFEVLREEWRTQASLGKSEGATDVVLRARHQNGYATMPAGVFFNHAAAVHLTWPAALPARRLTALRIFLETMGSFSASSERL
jgi:PAS domain S-box-containing protein